ncbi:MAG: hypothetical protein ABEJ95_06550 [Candidatus Nanohalobium sp.]
MSNSDEGSEEGERQEYYLSTIQDIVDEQKDFLGEQVALKQARRAPLNINEEGEVEDFYGSGEDALETLREFTEHQEFYLNAIQSIIDQFSEMLGEDVAYRYARKAPLEIMPRGEVQAYYGKGRGALETLVEQYEGVWGEEVAHRKVRNAMESSVPEEKYELLPEHMTPSDSDNGLIGQILSQLRG